MEDAGGEVKLGMPHDQRPESKELQKFLTDHCIHWRGIGLQLGLKTAVLDLVEAENRSPRDCYRVTLERWRQLNVGVTWGNLELAITNANRVRLGLEPMPTAQPTSQSQTVTQSGDNQSREDDETSQKKNNDYEPAPKKPRYTDEHENEKGAAPDITFEKLEHQFGEIKITKGVDDLKQMEIQVLIQTVNPKEFYAVMIQLNKKDGVSEYTVNNPNKKEKSRYYFVGKLSKSSIPVAIVQTQMGSNGEYGSRTETKVALHWLPNLRYIFAVGVCGGIKGIKEKLKLGKVVISKAIQDYSETKDEEDRLIICSPCWDCKNGNFYNFISRAAKLPVNAVCGVVLSANTLIKNDDTRKKLLQACPEAIAFEMEGHGIAGACREKRIEILIVKGVSDFGDKNKSDIWQPQAAVNAATALCEVMGKYDAFDSTGTQTVDGKKQATKVIEETQEGEIKGETTLKGSNIQGND